MRNKFNDIEKDLDLERGRISGGYLNDKPSVPRPSSPPPTQRSSPSDQKGNDKKENSGNE